MFYVDSSEHICSCVFFLLISIHHNLWRILSTDYVFPFLKYQSLQKKKKDFVTLGLFLNVPTFGLIIKFKVACRSLGWQKGMHWTIQLSVSNKESSPYYHIIQKAKLIFLYNVQTAQALIRIWWCHCIKCTRYSIWLGNFLSKRAHWICLVSFDHSLWADRDE